MVAYYAYIFYVIKSISHYDLSVLSMTVLGFQKKKVWIGGFKFKFAKPIFISQYGDCLSENQPFIKDFNNCPCGMLRLTFVFFSRSEPARSTKFNFDSRYFALDCSRECVCKRNTMAINQTRIKTVISESLKHVQNNRNVFLGKLVY